MQDAIKTPSRKHNPKVTIPALRFNLRDFLWRLRPLWTFAVILSLWQIVVMLKIYPQFIIPAPLEVFDTFLRVVNDGSLWHHASLTLQEIFWGMLIGVSLGTSLGYLIAHHPLLEDLLSPVIVAFQSTPIVAYAPLLIIWFGSGITSKIITCAIIVFFPTLMNTLVGLRNIPQNLHDLMRSLRASRWYTFTKLELPAALPVLLTGLKTSATLAVIGAVVGEFVSANRGLGFLVTIARNHYDTALVFVAVFTMTAIALALYTSVSLLEWRLLSWQRRIRREETQIYTTDS